MSTGIGIELADVIIKGFALLGTGLFFGYKTLSGFNNQNLSLALQCDRVPDAAETDRSDSDLVLLAISIEKGTTAALALQALEARFSWGAM